MIFEFPSARKCSYVRRSFGNEGSLRDHSKNSCGGNYRNGRFVIYFFCPPGLLVVRCFVPRETRLLIFFNSSPLKSKDSPTAYFEQFKSLGIKHLRPPWWKSAQFTWLKKKITTPRKLMKISKAHCTHLNSTRSCLIILQCYNESYFQLYFLCSLDKTIPLSLVFPITMFTKHVIQACQLTKCHAVTTLHLPCLKLQYQNISDHSKACFIHRNDLTCYATVYRLMKTADVCPLCHTLGNYWSILGQLFLWQNYSASIYLIHFKLGTVKDIFMVNVSIVLDFFVFFYFWRENDVIDLKIIF